MLLQVLNLVIQKLNKVEFFYYIIIFLNIIYVNQEKLYKNLIQKDNMKLKINVYK